MKEWGQGARPALSAAGLLAGGLACVGALLIRPLPADAAASDPAATLKVLSASDAARYTEAFAAEQRGDFAAGAAAEKAVADPVLVGELDSVRLLNPSYRANYAELKSWLDHYGDLPEAARIYDLALKRRPRGAPPPKAPPAADSAAIAERTDSPHAAPAADARQAAARQAFYDGQIDRAYALATASGERWIAGLAAFRLKRYDDAFAALSALAQDPRENAWARSAAAYWASRSATAAGLGASRTREFLKLAAREPDTFYGLIATRELDQQADAAPEGDPIGDVLEAAAVDPASVAELTRTSPEAHRAAALVQIGRKVQAGDDLRAALAAAPASSRPALMSLALALNAPLGDRQDIARRGWAKFDSGHYPTPVLSPQGGFTIDKALVYALVRQESRFDPNVTSAHGAYGLMQIKAETAARLTGDDRLKRDPAELRNPAVNLKVGQAYVAKLLQAVKGDVIRAVAAYNCGPGVIDKLVAKMGQDVDSLMLIESMPSGQTRDYVQRVMAGYWTYRQIFGLDSQTLNAAAAGVKAVASADR